MDLGDTRQARTLLCATSIRMVPLTRATDPGGADATLEPGRLKWLDRAWQVVAALRVKGAVTQRCHCSMRAG